MEINAEHPQAKERQWQDVEFLAHTKLHVVCVKSQPWIKPQEFGMIDMRFPTTVKVHSPSGEVIRADSFQTLGQLAEKWSID